MLRTETTLPKLRSVTPAGVMQFVKESVSWSRSITLGKNPHSWEFRGCPNFSAGRSAQRLDLAVVKQGDKCDGQLEYVERLRVVAGNRLPAVIARWRGGYAMEALGPYEPDSNWPVVAELIGATTFWDKEPVVYNEATWQGNLKNKLDIVAPHWSHLDQHRCAIHGDMTLCNTMRRRATVVFVDPTFPERTPQIAAVDHARILQSVLGWELMIGHQRDVVHWQMPRFVRDGDEHSLRVVLFWCSVGLARTTLNHSTCDEIERGWAEHLLSEMRSVL